MDFFRQIGKEPLIAYETEKDSVIAGLVAQDFGIAVVPCMEMLLRLDVKILQITREFKCRAHLLYSILV